MRAEEHPLEGVALVTGASGFIGRHLHNALLERGLDVVTLRRSSSPEPTTGRSMVVDYADQARLDEIMTETRPNYVFHVAGATKGVSDEDFARANVMPTQNLLLAVQNVGHVLDRFVLMSSLAAYGPSEPGQPHIETNDKQPVELYGKSKMAAEQAVESAPVPYTILRPGGVYGPGDIDYFQAFKMVAKGWSVFFGNRHRSWSAVYVDDLVEATLTAATHPSTLNRGYFISDGHPITWETFQRLLGEVSGRKVRELDLPEALVNLAAAGGEFLTALDGQPRLFNRQKATMGRQTAWECRPDAAERDFDFRARVSLNEGATRAFAWYREQGWI